MQPRNPPGVMTEHLSPNLEDYLETIFVLESATSSARAKDIADRMKVQRASVTGALHALSEKGLINYQPYSSVTLTPEGFRLATRIMHRHKVLKQFFEKFLQLPPDVAENNACRIEHQIDDTVLERLTKFTQFFEECPRTATQWLDSFTRFCTEGELCDDCLDCLQRCTDRARDT
jgi:DtxR family transcriptional regulator, Mn-dependent transcriptional regulator